MKDTYKILKILIVIFLKRIISHLISIALKKMWGIFDVFKQEKKRKDLYEMYFSGDINVAELQKFENKVFKEHRDDLIRNSRKRINGFEIGGNKDE